MAKYGAAIFDVFGTVVDWRNSIAREAEASLAPKGYALDWHAFADAWRGRYQPAMQRIRAGERPFMRLDLLHRENLVEILPDFGISGLSEAELDHLNKAWHRLDPWPGAVEGLTRLKSKYILATQSNGNIALMVNMAKRAGIPWDVIMSSDATRGYKPDPKTYLGAARMMGLEPHEVMMCAAHNNDLEAAANHGLRTAYINRPNEYGPDQERDFEATGDWDIQTDGIEGIADALGC